MQDFDSKMRFENTDYNFDCELQQNIEPQDDLIMESILEHMNSTPIGSVLKKITALPEIRQEKVLDIRTRLTQGRYDLEEGLGIAMDKVLEDLIA